MTVSELITKLKAMNPEAEVHQMYDGMAKPIRVVPADNDELEAINEVRRNDDPEAKDLTFAVVFWAG